MAWKYTVDFSEWFRSENADIENKGKLAAGALNRLIRQIKDEDLAWQLEELADEFNRVQDVDEFDAVLEQLYDLGDWYGIWINTVR